MKTDIQKPERAPKPSLPPKPPRTFKRQKSKPSADKENITNDQPIEKSEKQKVENGKPAVPPKRPPPPSPKAKSFPVSNGESEYATPMNNEYLDSFKMIDDQSETSRDASPSRLESASPLPTIPTIQVTDESAVVAEEPQPTSSLCDQPSITPPSNRSAATSPKSTIKSRRKIPVADGEGSESSDYDSSCCMPKSKISVIIKHALADMNNPNSLNRSFSSPAQKIYQSPPKPPVTAPKPSKPPPRPKPPDLSKRTRVGGNQNKQDDEGTEDSTDYKDIDFKKRDPKIRGPYEELGFGGGPSYENLNDPNYHPYEEIGPHATPTSALPAVQQYEKISVCENLAPTGNISEIESTDGQTHNEEAGDTLSGDTTDTLSMKESIVSEYITPTTSVTSLPLDQSPDLRKPSSATPVKKIPPLKPVPPKKPVIVSEVPKDVEKSSSMKVDKPYTPVLLKATKAVVAERSVPVIAPTAPAIEEQNNGYEPVKPPQEDLVTKAPTVPIITTDIVKVLPIAEYGPIKDRQECAQPVTLTPEISPKSSPKVPPRPKAAILQKYQNKREIMKEIETNLAESRVVEQSPVKTEPAKIVGSYSLIHASQKHMQNVTYESYRKLPDPDEIKPVKKTPPVRPPPPQPKRPPRKKQRSQTATVTRDEVYAAREKFQRSKRSQSLTEADLAKRLWMAEKPIRPPIDIKTLYTKVQKDPNKNNLTEVNKLKLDVTKKPETCDLNMQCRPLPAPPPPPRSKKRSGDNTPQTAFAQMDTPKFTKAPATVEAHKLAEKLEHNGESPYGSDRSSLNDSMYPKSRWYDDGNAADESNMSSLAQSIEEGLNKVVSQTISSSRSSSNARRCEKRKTRDKADMYCYQFNDKSETSDTESSIKIRIRIEKKTERGGEEKVVVKRSVPVTEVVRVHGAETECKLSTSDSLSQIPDLVSHEEADSPVVPRPDVVTITSSSDSWHSALDTSSESEGEEETDNKHRNDRMYLIAEEIMMSEQSYVNVLKLMNQDFRKHVSKCLDHDGNSVISESCLDSVLNYLPQLQTLSENLLIDLCNRINNWDDYPRLADVLVKIGPFFMLYSSYVREFESMNNNLDDICRKNLLFAKALKEFEMSEKCKSLALKHYMLKPVQRIPQYKLLLERYLKYVPESSEEYNDAHTALSIVSKVADHINQSIKDVDNFNKMIQLQSSIIGNFELIRPGRTFVMEGSLNKLSRKGKQPRWFVLLNDCLLYMTATPQGYKINYNLPLSGLKVMIPTQEEYQNEFSIISIIRSFSLSASSQEERQNWITAINKAIENNITRRNTYNNVGHVEGSRSDSEISSMKLGNQAPVWIPDARVTMCQICTTDFTVTFRRHHCRACGKVVCKRCSANQAPLQYRKYRPARVCDECFDKLDGVSAVKLTKLNTTRLGSPETESDATETETSSLSSNTADSYEQAIKSRYGRTPLFVNRKIKAKSALTEVTANDESSEISGYLQHHKSKKNWKKSWFVIKDKVLYRYRASEDIKALESTPLLGYEVSFLQENVDGVEDGLMFQLCHRGRPSLVFQTDTASNGHKWFRIMSDATVL